VGGNHAAVRWGTTTADPLLLLTVLCCSLCAICREAVRCSPDSALCLLVPADVNVQPLEKSWTSSAMGRLQLSTRNARSAMKHAARNVQAGERRHAQRAACAST
jgi:hypothetical protein